MHDSTANTLPNAVLDGFSDTPWPTALLTLDGRVLALSHQLAGLCGAGELHVGGDCMALLPEPEQARLPTLIAQVCATGAASISTYLTCGGQPLPVELEAFATPANAPQWVTLIGHQASRAHQRERQLLAFNWIAPKLLLAQSFGDVFHQVGQGLLALGITMTVALLSSDERHLVLQHSTISRHAMQILEEEAQRSLALWPIAVEAVSYHEVLTERHAHYRDDWHRLLVNVLPPNSASFFERLLALRGVAGYIIAPLYTQERVRGAIVIWSQVISANDVPWTEAISYQISTALQQIELREQTHMHIQRLGSLATTAQAVTTLESLEGTLRIICTQAQQLFTADYVGVHLPIAEGSLLQCVMAVGQGAEQVIGMHYPIGDSLNGRVFQEQRGRIVDDVRVEPLTYIPSLAILTSRAALFQPFVHQGITLGVIVVGHPERARFQQADLDFLARYAEHAAVAVANAQLHNALQASEQRYRQLNEQAEADRTYLRALIEHTPDIMFTLRRDMTIHTLTPTRIFAFSGYTSAEVEGRSFLRFVPDRDQDTVLRYWHALLDGQALTLKMQILKADGTMLPSLVSAVRVPAYDQVFVILKDLTEIRRLEADMRRVEGLAALGRMAAGAAHELNNPLAVVLGMTQLALLEDLPPTVRNDLRSVEAAALRAGGIVEQLRAFSAPQPAQAHVIDASTLIDEVLQTLAHDCTAHQVVVQREIERDMLPIAGNYVQLSQVLTNLCRNALQSLAASPPPRLRHLLIRAWAEHDCVRLTIKDTGLGIAAEHLPYIFEPFYTTRPVGDGIGLGLSIAHTLVQQQGGRIWAESVPDEWTVFHLALPTAAPHAVAQDRAQLESEDRMYPDLTVWKDGTHMLAAALHPPPSAKVGV